jgi:hypothetical protein
VHPRPTDPARCRAALAAAGSALLAALPAMPGRPATSCRSRYAPKPPAQLICRAYGMQPHAAVRSKGGTHSSSASHRRLQLLLRGLGHEQHPTTAVEREPAATITAATTATAAAAATATSGITRPSQRHLDEFEERGYTIYRAVLDDGLMSEAGELRPRTLQPPPPRQPLTAGKQLPPALARSDYLMAAAGSVVTALLGAGRHIEWLQEQNPERRPEQFGHELVAADPFWVHLVSAPQQLAVCTWVVWPVRSPFSFPTPDDSCAQVRLVSDPRLLAIAQQYVGDDIALFASHYICKPPGDGQEVLYHQDGSYWPLEPMEVVTLWLCVPCLRASKGEIWPVVGMASDRADQPPPRF